MLEDREHLESPGNPETPESPEHPENLETLEYPESPGPMSLMYFLAFSAIQFQVETDHRPAKLVIIAHNISLVLETI